MSNKQRNNQKSKPKLNLLKKKKKKDVRIDIANDEEKVSLNPNNEIQEDNFKEDNNNEKIEKGFYGWIKRNPFNVPFLTFLSSIAICFLDAVFHFMDSDWAFIIAGLLGLSVSIYGFRHFYQLMGLVKGIDDYERLNIKFNKERVQLDEQIEELTSANKDLQHCQQRMRKANLQNKKNVQALAQVRHTMQELGEQNIKGLLNLTKKTEKIGDQWHDQLLKRERSVLHKVFDQYERRGACKVGMTEDDFKGFAQALPDGYWDRFQRMGTFHSISGDNKIIDFDDFRIALDLFAEMETDDVDIHFTIEKQRKPKSTRHGKGGKSGHMNINDHKLTGIPEMKSADMNDDEISEKTSLMNDYSIDLPTPDSIQEWKSIQLSDVFEDMDDDEKMPEFNRRIVVTETHKKGTFKRLGKIHTKRGILDGVLSPEISLSPSEMELDKKVNAALNRENDGSKHYSSLPPNLEKGLKTVDEE